MASEKSLDLEPLLEALTAAAWSDLTLTAGRAPQLGGPARPRALEAPAPSAADLEHLAEALLDPLRRRRLETEGRVRAAHVGKPGERFRVEFRRDASGLAAAFRHVHSKLPEPEKRGPWPSFGRLSGMERGLILIGGPPGSGRSTVQAILLEAQMQDRGVRILTVEDPIERIHVNTRSLVTQRELGRDVHSLTEAVDAAFRDLPDVVALGPLQDAPTIEAALRLAEAGVLVFGTTDASSVTETRQRLIEVFPEARRGEVLRRIAAQLAGIYCQILLPRMSGDGWVPAYEVLFGTEWIRSRFAAASDKDLVSAMSTGAEHVPSSRWNVSLAMLYFEKAISGQTALAASPDRDELSEMIERGEGLTSKPSPPWRPRR